MKPNNTLKKTVKQSETLLVIDDNLSIHKIIENSLGCFYHIEKATNGKSGLEKAFKLLPDLVILDVYLPEMNGIDICQSLKRSNQTGHIPVILISGSPGITDEMSGLVSGADSYVSKPFDTTELLLRVKNLISQRERIKEFYNNVSSIKGYTPDSILREEVAYESGDQDFLLRVKEVVHNNFQDPDFSSSDLEQEIGMSHATFYRKLKSVMGFSGSALIRKTRINAATDMLKNSDLNISEIAYKTGFNDPIHFSKSFKKVVGVSPKTFRKRYLRQKVVRT